MEADELRVKTACSLLLLLILLPLPPLLLLLILLLLLLPTPLLTTYFMHYLQLTLCGFAGD